ncbi:PD-(D/E)XK nuclease family protein [Heliophilum fasciatum]|uniref:PD-(D/E)XK nuclease superfamily protein n=1 Tax=Heliophilum fasciatum TaxID=35700 RepID=A0A4R2RD90_9FIRM|nr:PD-(D/E)XK nuclease family protein [Heliophilum fasciatum]MCW2279283.1 CRISPR/Cas system-associated exonuclease Cas4 (RecB family) [Heliophilum fasciatum]TCP60444.1 PD-(D/E)XK nuclease superfamily protein [Heliophilum fasciatum]
MGLTNKAGAAKLRETVAELNISVRGTELTAAILDHFNRVHSGELMPDIEIERLLMETERLALEDDKSGLQFQKGIVTFSPSSASKCERELYFRADRIPKEEGEMMPYQRRWVRNGSAVHAAVQRDLLYAEKYLTDPAFTVVRTKKGLPAWEKNVRQVRPLEYDGVKFQIYGMMDGVLQYRDGLKIGFEFKTKSTTLGAIGHYKMKDAQEDHKTQCVAYSLLFGLREFLIVYESLAKDGWMKGHEAKPDIRAFYLNVTDEDRDKLLQKFAGVARKYYAKEMPSKDPEKCIFCPYKMKCKEIA